MMATKKPDPSITSKEVESEIAALAGENQGTPKPSDDLKTMFQNFMKKQDSIATASQQTNESILSAVKKVISSVSPQQPVRAMAHSSFQEASMHHS